MPKNLLIIGKNSLIAKKFSKKISSDNIIAPSQKEWNMNEINFNKEQLI